MSDISRRLPVGAEAQPDGSTHFRVWAPDPRTVSLKLESGAQSRTIALEREEHGYYSALVDDAGAGTRYRYLLDEEPLADPASRYQPDGPFDLSRARECLAGFESHLNEAGIGTISEIFDAEPPYTPRGCIAEAWSVAEVLRAWLKTEAR